MYLNERIGEEYGFPQRPQQFGPTACCRARPINSTLLCCHDARHFMRSVSQSSFGSLGFSRRSKSNFLAAACPDNASFSTMKVEQPKQAMDGDGSGACAQILVAG